jgi:hypothetical protein
MPRYDIAHIREQGQDIIIVPLESSFGNSPSSSQQETIATLQLHTRAAGLAGQVVPVWDNGGGRMSFIAPHPWHPFFSGLNLSIVATMINKYVSW